MLTIAVCDDNIQFAKRLVEKIRTLCAKKLPDRIVCNVAMEFSSAEDVLNYLKKHTINILFLDIDMPKCNGFELAAALNKDYPDIIIIFVSAYDNFVYSSFDYRPFRFLRKSHLQIELPDTFEKVISKYITSQETFTFSSTEGDVILRLKDIYYIESQKNYYNIYHADNQVYKCRGTISEIESNTERFDFFRIHAAYVVNLENIERIINANSILMKNGSVLNISQRRLKLFRETYMNFTRKRFARW